MRALQIRWLSLAAFALFASIGNSIAQDKSPALLNALEVQQLVKRAEPADQARLGAHYTAPAERYTVEAAEHTAMGQSFTGNPRRNLGTGMSAHCKHLADLNTQSATAAKELASYHQKLAAGAAVTPPRNGARLEAGVGARVPTALELKALAAKAGTPAEHMATAHAYRGTKTTQAAVHCDQLVALSKDAAKEATEAAAMHKQLAGVAR